MSRADSQVSALHAAEKEFCRLGSGALTKRQARSLIAEVCEYYSLPRIRLQIGCRGMPNRTWAWACYEDRKIIFNRWGSPLVRAVVLHELAHMVVQHYWGRESTEDHGREFCGVLMHLYDKYYVMPTDALALIFRRHGVKYRPVRFCVPEAVPEHGA